MFYVLKADVNQWLTQDGQNLTEDFAEAGRWDTNDDVDDIINGVHGFIVLNDNNPNDENNFRR